MALEERLPLSGPCSAWTVAEGLGLGRIDVQDVISREASTRYVTTYASKADYYELTALEFSGVSRRIATTGRWYGRGVPGVILGDPEHAPELYPTIAGEMALPLVRHGSRSWWPYDCAGDYIQYPLLNSCGV